jgi:RNA polymerase sigma-70 factor (ECF subfamily)
MGDLLNKDHFVNVWNNSVPSASHFDPPKHMTEAIDLEQERQIKEDIHLIQRIAERDSAAFQKFYGKYSGLIFAAISNVLNDHHDTEDVMQEVLVQLWNKAHLYEPRKGKPLTWLTTMARNRAIDRIRSKQRRSRLNDDFELENKKLQFEFQESGHEILEEKERDTIVQRAVSKLNDDQRQAIHLAYFSGLTQAEVAERLNEPLGTIKARIRRGVSRLEGLVKPRLA